MKYLQDDRLSAITARLLTPDIADPMSAAATHQGGGGAKASSGRRVRGKIEAYTTKRTSTDKKYASNLGIKYVTSLQRHNDSVEQLQQQQQRQQQEEALQLQRAQSDAPFKAAHSPPRKRRAHSVGFQGDLTSSSLLTQQQRISNKKPRSRSNSLDDNVLSYHTALGDFAAQETRRLMTDFVLTLNMSFPDYDFEEVSPNDFEKVPLGQVVQHVQNLLLTDSTSSATVTAPPPAVAIPPHELEGGTDSSIVGPVPPDTQASTQGYNGDYDNGDGSVSEFAYNEASSTTTDPLRGDDRGVSALSSDPRSDNGGTRDLLTELWSALDGAIRLQECEIYRWTNPPEGLLSDSDLDDLGNGNAVGGTSSTDDVVTVWSFYYLFVNKSWKRIVFFCCAETLVNRHAAAAAAATSDDGLYMDYVDDTEDDHVLTRVQGDDGNHDVDLVSEQDNGIDDDDDEDEDGIVTSSQHYKMIMSSVDASSTEADFDLDPAAVAAGGIPISTV